MLQYIIAGLALGSIYAIASSSLVVTFVSAGVLNFAFGSMAYFVARFYYWFNSQHGWPTYTAGIVSILVVGPLLGVILYALVFRYIRGKPTMVKLAVTIGLWVALPALLDTVFGPRTITSAPGLASLSDKPYHFLGAPVTTDQVITYGFLLFVLIVGTIILRFTDIGLRVRAVVDSEAMTSLSGTHPGRVAVGVWAVTSALAGVAGILVAPSQGLSAAGMTALMAAAFAPVVVARLRSLPIAVVASLVMGIVTDVIQKWLPPNSSLTADLIESVPFIFIVGALVFYVMRSGSVDEEAGLAGPLDQAIKPANLSFDGTTELRAAARRWPYLGLIPLGILALLPLIFHGSSYWLGATAFGFCYGVILLTFTLVTGEGGMLWLAQIIFAGIGALATAQFATVEHLPVLLGVLIGGVIAAVAGAIIGLLTIRFGDLYVGLVTLTAGVLIEDLVFTRNRFLQGGLGVNVNRPSFATSDFKFGYLAFAVFLILALLTINLRRSTSGLALRAVRDSEPASRTLGLSILQVKVIVGALAAFVAAVGGGFFAMYSGNAQPQTFDVFAGLVWLAVLVALGSRSILAAAIAGMSFSMVQDLFQTYVPARWGEVPTILFGLGALGMAKNPEGAILQNSRMIRAALNHFFPAKGMEAFATAGQAWQATPDGRVPAESVESGSTIEAKAAP